jgi:hypothetical protein
MYDIIYICRFIGYICIYYHTMELNVDSFWRFSHQNGGLTSWSDAWTIKHGAWSKGYCGGYWVPLSHGSHGPLLLRKWWSTSGFRGWLCLKITVLPHHFVVNHHVPQQKLVAKCVSSVFISKIPNFGIWSFIIPWLSHYYHVHLFSETPKDDRWIQVPSDCLGYDVVWFSSWVEVVTCSLKTFNPTSVEFGCIYIFEGKIHGFRLRFSLKPIQWYFSELDAKLDPPSSNRHFREIFLCPG